MDPELPAFDRRGEPVTVGVAVPRGQVSRSDAWSLIDAGGTDVPVQTTTLDRWGDGSVRWQLVEFHATAGPSAATTYSLRSSPDPPPAKRGLSVERAGENLLVVTGAARFSVPRSGTALFADVQVSGLSILGSSSIDAEDEDGQRYRFITRRTTVERAGPLRAILHLDGGLDDADGVRWVGATVRLHFFAGLGTVRIELAVTNPRAASHRGGRWNLGDPGSVLLRDLSVAFSRRVSSNQVAASIDRADPLGSASSRQGDGGHDGGPGLFALYQDSSGGQRWRHANHVNRDGVVATTFQGYRALRGATELSGLRANPVVTTGVGDEQLTLAPHHFWETFPKAIEADAARLVFGVLPRHFADTHELQAGERMSATVSVCFGPDSVSDEPLFWVRSPLHVHADPASYERAGMCAPLARGSRAARELYDRLVDVAVRGDDSLRHRRETIDEYGWRNFGEIWADHELVGQPGPQRGSRARVEPGPQRGSRARVDVEPLVSHCNNQSDALAGLATRFLQTGDHRWWTLADELAAHVTDIDLYHSTEDRAAYNGGHFGPTPQDTPAQTATHRASSTLAGARGGGPSNEHNYTTGLMLHYFLTGSESSREAVVQLADWVLDTGGGRAAANSINALLDAHRLAGDPRYLEKADRLLARCVRPAEGPATAGPFDAENRRSYTVLLQTLGKYLEYCADRDLIDERYEYARAALLRFARWICVNGRPDVDDPGRLEQPTEPFAPQDDLRKAAVLEFAARHTQEANDYATFLARADEFVDSAISTLARMPTSRLAQSIVLLLAYGVQRPCRLPWRPLWRATLDRRQSKGVAKLA